MRPRFINAQLAFEKCVIPSWKNHPSVKVKPPILKFLRYFTNSAAAASVDVAVSSPFIDDEFLTINEDGGCPKTATDVLRRWGCSDTDLSRIFDHQPALRNSDIAKLQSKLTLLSTLGLTSPDLVQIINSRHDFLSFRIHHCPGERLEYLQDLFGSKQLLLKAITKDPHLLTYDLNSQIKPVVTMYYEMGISRQDLVAMLLSRPTLIPRTSFNEEKLDYIRRIGISKDSKMYKYVVTQIAVSRVETIREKLSNFDKFGFSEDEIFGLIGRSPLILTLSVDKVQRNMTFVLGTMKLSARVVLDHPFLLYINLESVSKPRIRLAGKIEEKGLVPQMKGPGMLRALRMTDKRLVEAFVKCHPKEIADELMEFYTNAKGVKRLAESSKKNLHKGFPY